MEATASIKVDGRRRLKHDPARLPCLVTVGDGEPTADEVARSHAFFGQFLVFKAKG